MSTSSSSYSNTYSSSSYNSSYSSNTYIDFIGILLVIFCVGGIEVLSYSYYYGSALDNFDICFLPIICGVFTSCILLTLSSFIPPFDDDLRKTILLLIILCCVSYFSYICLTFDI